MQGLFEHSDYLTSPYEAFVFDSNIGTYPVKNHWHYFCEILYVIEGTASITCNDQSYNISKGDFVFFHPQSLHSIFGEKHVKYYVIKFDLSLIKMSGSHIASLQKMILAAQGNSSAPIVVPGEKFEKFDIIAFFETCINEVNEKNYGYDLCIQSYLTSMLTFLLRIWRTYGFQTDEATRIVPTSNSMQSIIEYIDENLNQPLRVEDLATMCNMSYSYFAKQFHTIYGRSCKEYIAFMRISRAKDLLQFTNYDLNYIAQETGFADCSHLIRTFRKLENTTPKQYRMSLGIII